MQVRREGKLKKKIQYVSFHMLTGHKTQHCVQHKCVLPFAAAGIWSMCDGAGGAVDVCKWE